MTLCKFLLCDSTYNSTPVHITPPKVRCLPSPYNRAPLSVRPSLCCPPPRNRRPAVQLYFPQKLSEVITKPFSGPNSELPSFKVCPLTPFVPSQSLTTVQSSQQLTAASVPQIELVTPHAAGMESRLPALPTTRPAES